MAGGAGGPQYEADFSYSDEDGGGGGFNIFRYLQALLRHKWLIAGFAVVGLAAGVGATKLVQPQFQAQATIAIDVSRTLQSSPVQNSQLLESRAWLDFLRSFQVLDEVVRRRRLFIQTEGVVEPAVFAGFELAPQFTPGSYRLVADATGTQLVLQSAEGSPIQSAAVGDSLGAALGFRWVAPRLRSGQRVNFTVRTPRDAAVALSAGLGSYLPPQNSSFLRLTLSGADPAATSATLNEVADRFVELATLFKREKLTYSAQILREQLASAYADLRKAETDLETFKVSNITKPTERGATQIASGLAETRDPERAAFFQLRIDRESLMRDRDAIQRALRTSSDSGSLLLVALGTIPSVDASTELKSSLALLGAKRGEARALSIGFSSAHPPLQALEREIADLEQRTIPGQANSLIASLNQRIGDFDDRIAASSREMQQIPMRSSEQTRLERDLQIAQNIYTQFRVAYEQASLAERSASPDVRVLDRAVPPTTPLTDQLLMVIGAGLAGGLVLGVLVALLLDHFDKRLRYPDQVTRELGLHILGALPLVREGKDGKPLPGDDAQLTEALRAIRMSLTFAHGTAGAFITTVTSAGPGDGKSFVSANLARSFASSGHRTLLIDGDTRRGRLHRALNVERRPGLLDYLGGTATRDQVVRRVDDWGIDFIPCGTRSAGGPELLASSQMAQLIMSLRSEYAVIIVDSPPLGAGVDPLVLAALAGSLVLVFRTGVTDKDLAGARMQDIQRLPIRVLGAVLNDVKAAGLYKYYAYLPGYRAEDEVEAATPPPPKRSLLGKGR